MIKIVKKKHYILGRGRFPLYVTSFHAKIGVKLPWIKVEENNYLRPCLRSLPRHCLVTQRFSRWGETTVYTDPNKFVNGRISAQISQQIAAMLAVQKFARFPGFHVNESRICSKFCADPETPRGLKVFAFCFSSSNCAFNLLTFCFKSKRIIFCHYVKQ